MFLLDALDQKCTWTITEEEKKKKSKCMKSDRCIKENGDVWEQNTFIWFLWIQGRSSQVSVFKLRFRLKELNDLLY